MKESEWRFNYGSPRELLTTLLRWTVTTHGGFDNDAPTMQSVLRRVLDAAPGEPVAAFPQERAVGRDPWELSEPLPDELQAFYALGSVPARPPTPIPPSQPAPAPPAMPSSPPPTPNGARRRALCIGIDSYPRQPLAGCIRDAQTWAEALRGFGFETEMLLDRDATRDAILAGIERLIAGGQPGDVLVFQYAGHGTYFDDENGDEDDRRDEALCPIDLDTGAVVLDDEVRELFAQLGDNVNLTSFIDCCHSGSITRMAFRPGQDMRQRTITPTPAMRDFYRDLKAKQGRSRSAAPVRRAVARRDVTFAACQDHEVAWESNGQGEFTVRSMEVLGEHGLGLTNEAFYRAVLDRFGPNPRQKPNLDAEDTAKGRSLLAPLVAVDDMGRGPDGEADPRAVVRGLHQAVQAFEQSLSKLV